MKSYWQIKNGQGWFGAIAEIVPQIQGSVVRTLKRFNAERQRDDLKDWRWVWGELEPAFNGGGQLHEVSLDAWLRFYSPLSSRGN